MKTIKLTQGKVALVDDSGFEWLSKWKWCASESKKKTVPSSWYASRNTGKTTVSMNHVVGNAMQLGCESVDHKDGNSLNNQRKNLRPCTTSQNNANRRKSPNKTSRFKGVSWKSDKRRWRAVIKIGGKNIHIGYSKYEENAAQAYNFVADELFGEFARFNVV